MDLYEKRDRTNVLATEFLPEFEAGNIGVLGAAIYIEDRYLPEMALRVALDQIARLYAEVDDVRSVRHLQELARKFCERARLARSRCSSPWKGWSRSASDLNLLRVFFELGVRVIGLTHVRRNAAGSGGVFAASGSSRDGLTSFGRDLVQACEALGIMIDLAHINPAGFEDIFAHTTKPLIVSHTNARRYHDIERNISDEQIRMVGRTARRHRNQRRARESAPGRGDDRSVCRSYRACRRLDWD